MTPRVLTESDRGVEVSTSCLVPTEIDTKICMVPVSIASVLFAVELKFVLGHPVLYIGHAVSVCFEKKW